MNQKMSRKRKAGVCLGRAFEILERLTEKRNSEFLREKKEEVRVFS